MSLRVAHRRQFERQAIDVPVQLAVAAAVQNQVVPLAGGTFSARMTDVSGGGAHVITPLFLPRAAQVELEIPPGHGVPAGRVHCLVMTVRMVDREPRYGVGLRFEDPTSAVVEALQASEAAEGDA